MADDIPPAVRRAVYQRDAYKCRWCGRHNVAMHIHHIRYRSEGGKHVVDNLISLCPWHHQEAHSSKETFQPLLLELVAETPSVTMLQLQRWKDRDRRDRRMFIIREEPEDGERRRVGRLLAID